MKNKKNKKKKKIYGITACCGKPKPKPRPRGLYENLRIAA